MDEELRLLQAQFFAAQEAKSSIRLSERNVVELVNKLLERGLLDDELLHTVNGKEYLTQEKLRREMVEEIQKQKRISLVDLASLLEVDLFYVEREAQRITTADPTTSLVQGEILTTGYWDRLGEEVEETLQGGGQVSLGELARRFNVGSDVLMTAISERMGSIIHGKLEGGQLYTPAYVARIKAIVRGALRAVTSTTTTASLLATVGQLQGEGLVSPGVEGGLFSSVLGECVAEGAALGSMRGGGSSWTPAVFARSQRESVEAFYSQNGYVLYETLKKLGVASPKQYLQQKYPKGLLLETAFVHPSLVDQVEAVSEDAVASGGWCDAMSHVPPSFTVSDTVSLIGHCRAIHRIQREGAAFIMAETCVVSQSLLQSLSERFNELVRAAAAQAVAAKRTVPTASKIITVKEDEDGGLSGDDEAGPPVKGPASSKGKGGRRGGTGGGPSKPIASPDEEEFQEKAGGRNVKSKKKSGKGTKGSVSASVPIANSKGGGKGVAGKGGGEEDAVMSEGDMAARIVEWYPEMEGVGADGSDDGDGEGAMVRALAAHMRPSLVDAFVAARQAAFTAGAEDRKKRRDVLQTKLDELWMQMQLFTRGLEVFQADAATLAILQRHLLRTLAAEAADLLLQSQALEQRLAEAGDLMTLPPERGVQRETVLAAAERLALAKTLPGAMGRSALLLAEAVEGKSVEKFEEALDKCAGESGVRLRKLEKKAERALLFAHRKTVAAQMEAAEDPVSALPLVVALLFIQVHHCAVHAPGRAIAALLASLKEGLPSETFRVLSEYHAATVEHISRRHIGDSGEESARTNLEACLAAVKACAVQKQNAEGD